MKKAAIVLVALAGLFLQACGNRAASSRSEVGNENVAAARAAPASTEARPQIVAFGDSLTAGYGLRQSESYTALLQGKLDADGYKYEVINAGVSGDTTTGGLERIDWSLAGGDVAVVILELGANDILRGQSVARMQSNLAAIVERCQKRGARVLLAGMEAPPNMSMLYQRSVHQAFQEVAQKYGITLIPFVLDRVAGIESLNQSDGIHPNPEGEKIMADTTYQYLRPMLKD